MNISNHRYSESLPHFLQDFQRILVADTGKGIEAGTVCLAVRTFENIWYVQCTGNLYNLFCYAQGHVFAFYGTRAGHQEEIVGLGILHVIVLKD
ncbi:hypothetical protein D3C72_2308130 [compost metagenome]